ncbi:MAG: Concanavalin A-like lectin/glucanases superfamily protein/FecR protein [Verrucomicrobia bacterium]|nr:MAG: Concanavalin A-like lectin/glucanases superfamily protein/FecR protein [Verrucomicrobiota bacterium]
MKDDNRTQWMQEYLDGTADAQTTAKLESALQKEPEFRIAFLEYLNVDVALSAAAAFAPELKSENANSWVRDIGSTVVRPWLALAAGMVLMALLAWGAQSVRRPHALVTSSTTPALRQGASVKGALLKLDAGAVEFLTAKGARVVVEAPATVRFESAETLRVFRGKVAADVPPEAKGFTVKTPGGSAIDLGTRFGVDVPSAGEAEIHVFQGEVIAEAGRGGGTQNLHTGDALVMQQGGGTSRELRSSAFIQPDEMPQLSAGLASGQRARARAGFDALKRDSALVAIFDFGSQETLPGVFRMAQGRWPGSHAPEFVDVGDHVKLDVGKGKEWPQLTLATWVRIDQLGSPYQSLYHTDGWQNETPGQVHWMITKDSTMRLALRGNTLAPGSAEKNGFPDSTTSVLPERGRWVHLAAVYNAEARTVRFYLNGQFDKEILQETAHPARLGPAQIGNWNRLDRKLSGRMDEFLLLGRVLGDLEIRELYLSGNPYR